MFGLNRTQFKNREMDNAADRMRKSGGEQASNANRLKGRPRFEPGEACTEETQSGHAATCISLARFVLNRGLVGNFKP